MLMRIAGLSLLPMMSSVALMATAAPATSAGEMCLGQPATMVGDSSQATLTGTEGDDVIVTAGSTRIAALGGNDKVCVTSPGVRVFVSAGSGDDDIVATTAQSVVAYLGAGADTYEGGPHYDDVTGGDGGPGEQLPDTDADRITTGGGGDRVHLSEPSDAYRDVVSLGDGSDFLSIDIPQGAAAVGALADLGAGVDTVSLRRAEDGALLRWAIDAVAGTVSSAGSAVNQLPLRSAENYELLDLFPSLVDFRGTAADEMITGAGWGEVDLAGGDDTIVVNGTQPDQGPLNAGPGNDEINVSFRITNGTVDLRQGTVTGGGPTSIDIVGFEDAGVSGQKVKVVGDKGPNRLTANACTARVVGGKGRDFFGFHSAEDDSPGCSTADKRYVFLGGPGADTSPGTQSIDTLFGGPGNDTLAGGGRDDRIFGGGGNKDKLKGQGGNDRLFGGRGRADVAFGGKGKDLCRTERQSSCER
ncbi:hypothetical protein GCM10027020_09710 [Nocardioides salsibiostraticola]